MLTIFRKSIKMFANGATVSTDLAYLCLTPWVYVNRL